MHNGMLRGICRTDRGRTDGAVITMISVNIDFSSTCCHAFAHASWGSNCQALRRPSSEQMDWLMSSALKHSAEEDTGGTRDGTEKNKSVQSDDSHANT